MAVFGQLVHMCILESSSLKWQRNDIMLHFCVYCREMCLVSCKTMCVVFCKKCEAENVLIVVLIWAEVLLIVCQVFATCVLFFILVCKQSEKTVTCKLRYCHFIHITTSHY